MWVWCECEWCHIHYFVTTAPLLGCPGPSSSMAQLGWSWSWLQSSTWVTHDMPSVPSAWCLAWCLAACAHHTTIVTTAVIITWPHHQSTVPIIVCKTVLILHTIFCRHFANSKKEKSIYMYDYRNIFISRVKFFCCWWLEKNLHILINSYSREKIRRYNNV